MTIYTIYESTGKAHWCKDEEIESFDTRSEAEDYLRVLQKYTSNPQDFFIREEEEQHIWLENADCFCYGDWVD